MKTRIYQPKEFYGKLTEVHIITPVADQNYQTTLYFSYETLVAFKLWNTDIVVSENVWGPTTGKHLNYLDNGSKEAKAMRLPHADFEFAAKEAGLL